MSLRYCTYVEPPFDVEPRRMTIPVELPLLSTEPSGVRIKIRKFKFFGKLPKEIQVAIWTSAAKNPRCITIKRLLTRNRVKDHSYCSTYLRAVVSRGASVPAVLHTTYDSRQAGLKIYTLRFADLLQTGGIYFNFSLDSLHFPSSHDCEVFLGQRHLADNPRSSSHPSPSRVCKLPPRAAIDEVTQNLKHLVVWLWHYSSGVRNPSLTLDRFVSLESFVTGWGSRRAFNEFFPGRAARNFGAKWNTLVHRPEIDYQWDNDLKRITNLGVRKGKKATVKKDTVKNSTAKEATGKKAASKKAPGKKK